MQKLHSSAYSNGGAMLLDAAASDVVARKDMLQFLDTKTTATTQRCSQLAFTMTWWQEWTKRISQLGAQKSWREACQAKFVGVPKLEW